jgi:hypothetical protein
MPAHALSPELHRARITAFCQALAEGCDPPTVAARPGRRRAIVRALELLQAVEPGIKRQTLDSYTHDYPFPWPAHTGLKPKLTAEYLGKLGLSLVDGNRKSAPQRLTDEQVDKALRSKVGLLLTPDGTDAELLAKLLARKERGDLIEGEMDGHLIRLRLGRDIASRMETDPPAARVVSHDGVHRFGIATDMHLASKYCRLDELHDFYRICREEGVTVVLNAGNWIDGEMRFNKRDLVASGLDGQIKYLVENYPQVPGIQTWAISGDDHEGWYVNDCGVDIGAYAQMHMRLAGRTDWFDLGFMERDIELVHGKSMASAMLRLVHPGGGSSYALSYTPQKIVESYDGGDKPAAIVIGHYHKMDAFNYRNCWIVQGGCFQDQTPFMRKKKIMAHVGGAITHFRQDEETGALLTMGVEFYRYFAKTYRHGGFRYSGTAQKLQLPPRELGGE